MSLSVRSLVFLPLALALLVSHVQAADPVPARFYDGAARQIASSLQTGDGWCVVSARQPMVLIQGAPAVDCIRYRIVTAYTTGKTTNDQFYVDLTYGSETSWILTEFGLPTASGSSLAAAKRANEAVAQLDQVLGVLVPGIAAEPDAAVQAQGQLLVNVMQAQRAALVDLISKDVAAVGSSMK